MKKGLMPRFLKNFSGLLFIFYSFSAYSADSTFFRDDFERNELGNTWQASTSWSIIHGSAYNNTEGNDGKLRTSKRFDSSSYVIETKASGFTNNYFREFRITFGQHNLSSDSTYVLSYKPYEGGKLTLSLSTDNIYFPKSLDEAIIYPNLDVDKWYTFKIAHYKSGLIQVYIDKGEGYGDRPFLETIDSSYSKAGHIGWQIDTQTFPEDFFVDWITAYKPSNEKGAVHEKPLDDDLITQVSAKSGLVYTVAKLDSGINQYTDRSYTITSTPAYLNKASFIRTAMNDKRNVSDTFLTFFLKKDAIIYIGYDPRAATIPAWMNAWTKTGDKIGTSDPRCPTLDVYTKEAEAGELYPNPVLLGGNLSNGGVGAETNYIVAAIVRPDILPLQAEDASLSGAIVAQDNKGYQGTGYADYQTSAGSYVEWTVKIDVPGAYNCGFTYANGASTDRPLEVEFDGIDYGSLAFSSTFSWSTWSYLTGANVFFTRGTHKIRVTATGFSGPNIDQLSLFYTSPSILNTSVRKAQPRAIVSNKPGLPYKVYPNPFHTSTTIYYTAKEKATITLTLYNLQGQLIEATVKVAEPGSYNTNVNAGSLLPGIYVYKFQIGDETHVGKLIKE